MRFYGIQPSELNNLDEKDKLAMIANIPRIRAEEDLRKLAGTGAQQDKDYNLMYIKSLIDALIDDEDEKVTILGDIIKKRNLQEQKMQRQINAPSPGIKPGRLI